MNLQEIKEVVLDNGGIWFNALIVMLSLVEVSKIQINPWTWIAKHIGRAINGEVMDKIDSIQIEVNGVKQDVRKMKDDADEREASNCRTHILRFGDDLLHGIKHSKEHFTHVMLAISTYEQYCKAHPEYLNNVASVTIEYIEKTYQKCLDENDFL